MPSYTLSSGSDEKLGAETRQIRRAVFVEEQNVPESVEMDDRDIEATHFLLSDGETPVATARLRFVDATTAKVERVAVVKASRGEGLGQLVMDAAERHARENGAETVVVHAQRRVEGFYTELGYSVVGEAFEEAGILHVEMEKSLSRE